MKTRVGVIQKGLKFIFNARHSMKTGSICTNPCIKKFHLTGASNLESD